MRVNRCTRSPVLSRVTASTVSRWLQPRTTACCPPALRRVWDRAAIRRYVARTGDTMRTSTRPMSTRLMAAAAIVGQCACAHADGRRFGERDHTPTPRRSRTDACHAVRADERRRHRWSQPCARHSAPPDARRRLRYAPTSRRAHRQLARGHRRICQRSARAPRVRARCAIVRQLVAPPAEGGANGRGERRAGNVGDERVLPRLKPTATTGGHAGAHRGAARPPADAPSRLAVRASTARARRAFEQCAFARRTRLVWS